MNYLARHGSTTTIPQSEPMAPEQVENNAGGYVFALDPLSRVRRFLILGAEGGTYYVGEHDFVRDNLDGLRVAVEADGAAVVALIVDVSIAGRAKSNDPALFALAYCSVHGDLATRRVAYAALPKVARIGTHLFHFVEYREGFGGWTRGLRRAIARWYNDRPLADLAMQMIKYRQRDGWSHRDVLRLAHVKPDTPGRDLLFKFATTGENNPERVELEDDEANAALRIPMAFLRAQASDTPAETAAIIREFDLPREAVKTEHLDSVEVWEALLATGMPAEAMVRNLAAMTRNGTIKPLSGAETDVAATLRDPERIGNSKLHPLSVLNARAIYGAGGYGGLSLSKAAPFQPSNAVLGALDDAFHLAFGNVEPAGKRFLLGLDVSGSMGTHLGGSVLSCREAAAAMALVTMKTEAAFHAVAFASGGGSIAYDNGGRGYMNRYVNPTTNSRLLPLDFTGADTLAGVIQATASLDFGSTDCSLPMIYATERDLEVDCFIVYTDNETWAGNVHPAQALAEYRRKSGINAKLIVVGMTATDFSIADPQDPGMLDVVGFDTATPNMISAFARGEF